MWHRLCSRNRLRQGMCYGTIRCQKVIRRLHGTSIKNRSWHWSGQYSKIPRSVETGSTMGDNCRFFRPDVPSGQILKVYWCACKLGAENIKHGTWLRLHQHLCGIKHDVTSRNTSFLEHGIFLNLLRLILILVTIISYLITTTRYDLLVRNTVPNALLESMSCSLVTITQSASKLPFLSDEPMDSTFQQPKQGGLRFFLNSHCHRLSLPSDETVSIICVAIQPSGPPTRFISVVTLHDRPVIATP